MELPNSLLQLLELIALGRRELGVQGGAKLAPHIGQVVLQAHQVGIDVRLPCLLGLHCALQIRLPLLCGSQLSPHPLQLLPASGQSTCGSPYPTMILYKNPLGQSCADTDSRDSQ